MHGEIATAAKKIYSAEIDKNMNSRFYYEITEGRKKINVLLVHKCLLLLLFVN